MRAMGISSVKQAIDMQYLSTLKNCVTGLSKARTFYLYIIHKHSHYNMGSHSSLLSRSILMRAMGISSVKQAIDMQYLSTLKNCVTGLSKARTFYLYIIHKHSHYNMGSHSSLLSRSIKVCDVYNPFFFTIYVY